MSASKVKPNRKHTRKVDVSKALMLRQDNNLTYQEIAKIQGTTKQAVHSAIKDLLPSQDTDHYKKNRADILSEKQRIIINELDQPTIKRIMDKHPGAGALWFNSLFNNERLERGQSTSHIMTIHADLQAIKDARKQVVDEDLE